jgi:hypothetical protein
LGWGGLGWNDPCLWRTFLSKADRKSAENKNEEVIGSKHHCLIVGNSMDKNRAQERPLLNAIIKLMIKKEEIN